MLSAGSIPAMPALLLMPDAVPSEKSESEETLKGRLPDSHETASASVPVPKPSQIRWRGRILAE